MQAMREGVAFGYLASQTLPYDVLNIFEHVRSIVVFLGHQIGLVLTKMPRYGPSMNFSKDELTGSTLRHT